MKFIVIICNYKCKCRLMNHMINPTTVITVTTQWYNFTTIAKTSRVDTLVINALPVIRPRKLLKHIPY